MTARNDLFTKDLDRLTWADIDAFVGLEDGQGRPEGARVEFKREHGAAVFEAIVRFANDEGGLILVGIDAPDRVATGIPGMPKKRTDFVTRFNNMLQDHVTPLPFVEIGVVAVPERPDREVGVLRVAPGTFPPYMFTGGGKRRIVLGTGDTTRDASLREIEDLFEARERLNVPLKDETFGLASSVQAREVRDAGRFSCLAQGTLLVRPMHAPPLHLDDRLEQRILGLVAQHAIEPIQVTARHARSVEFGSDAETLAHHTAWLVGEDGSYGFATQLADGGGPAKPEERVVLLSEMANELVLAAFGANAVLTGLGCRGLVRIEIKLQLHRAALRLGRKPHEHLAGVFSVADPTEDRWPPTPFRTETSLADLRDPAGFLARAISLALREQRAARTDLEQLKAWIQARVQAVPERPEDPSAGVGRDSR